MALLDTDVDFKVVKEFVAKVKDRAIGAEMTKSLTPGQEAVDRVAGLEHSPSSMSTKAGKAIPKQTIGL